MTLIETRSSAGEPEFRFKTPEPLELPPRHKPIECRAAGEVTAVSWPERTIELLAVPYDESSVRVMHDGRQIEESIAPGAFDGIEKRAARVKVNRDHDIARTMGRALTLHPNDPRGLLAELRIAAGPAGDEALSLAADGILDASIGFAPIEEEWAANNTRRRVTKAFLHHIAMVFDPAYENAQVLAVRGAAAIPQPVETPVKDKMLALLAEAGYVPPQQ